VQRLAEHAYVADMRCAAQNRERRHERLADDFDVPVAGHRIDPGGRLVEEHDLGMVD
jgi:hypothetical protein